ncbi:hypothetical protein HMI56_005302, partial [Coelomomyces lativittatus]
MLLTLWVLYVFKIIFGPREETNNNAPNAPSLGTAPAPAPPFTSTPSNPNQFSSFGPPSRFSKFSTPSTTSCHMLTNFSSYLKKELSPDSAAKAYMCLASMLAVWEALQKSSEVRDETRHWLQCEYLGLTHGPVQFTQYFVQASTSSRRKTQKMHMKQGLKSQPRWSSSSSASSSSSSSSSSS